MTELVLLEMVDDLAVVSINNPQARNALSLDVLKALRTTLQELNSSGEARAMVLTGTGKHFCAGGDVSGMTHQRSVRESRSRIPIHAQIAREIIGGPTPVIAAVEGWSAGAGLSLVAAADFVVCSRESKFSAAFGRMGLLPDLGLLWSLPQRIGLPHAKRMFFAGRVLKADEALDLGLADQLCEPGEALATAKVLAGEYASCAPLSTAIIKSAYATGISNLEDALRCELDNQPALFQTRDHREAVNAFLEKREPSFQNA